MKLNEARSYALSSFRAISAEASRSDRFFVENDAFSSLFAKNCTIHRKLTSQCL